MSTATPEPAEESKSTEPVPTAGRVGIIGGGLGGLALAHFLRRLGISATVFERDTSPISREQGYVIGLIPRSVKMLEPLADAAAGLTEALSDPANEHSQFTMTDAQGNPVMEITGADAAGHFIYRPALRRALLNGIDVRYGMSFAGYEEHADRVDVTFSNGTCDSFDVLIGADGANSVVRRARAPGIKYNDLGITNLAGVLPYDAAPRLLQDLSRLGLGRVLGADGYTIMCLQYRGTNAVLQRGEAMNEVGEVPREFSASAAGMTGDGANGSHVLLWSMSHPGAQSDWLGLYTASGAAAHDEYDDGGARMREELRALYVARMRERFHPAFAEVIAATPVANLFGPRQVYSTDADAVPMQHGPTPRRVYLIGDASHATTTHMGMGANTALLDAFETANALASVPVHQWPAALHANEATLVARGVKIVKGSRQSTGMIHATGFFGRTGRFWMLKVFATLMRWAPWLMPKRE